MNKWDLRVAIAGMIQAETRTIHAPYLNCWKPSNDPVAMSAQSTHNQNGGEPWKKSNKRRMNK